MRWVSGVAVAAVLVVGGCSADGGQEPPGLTASPTASESPASTPDPTPTAIEAGPIDRSDPELGIVFTDLPEVTGDARAALDVLTLFEVEFWRALTSGTVDPVIQAMAAPEVVALVQGQLDGNVSRGTVVSGTTHLVATIDEATANLAIGSVCADYSEVLFTRDGTTSTAVEAGVGQADLVTVELGKTGGSWLITSYEVTGTC